MPNIKRLWNHTIRVYREPNPEDARDALGHVSLLPLPIGAAPTGFNCRPDQAWAGSLQDNGPGEQQGSIRRWFLDKSLDVQTRDVLSVIAGPESPMLLRVQGEPTKATNPAQVHHIEVNTEIWYGELGGGLES